MLSTIIFSWGVATKIIYAFLVCFIPCLLILVDLIITIIQGECQGIKHVVMYFFHFSVTSFVSDSIILITFFPNTLSYNSSLRVAKFTPSYRIKDKAMCEILYMIMAWLLIYEIQLWVLLFHLNTDRGMGSETWTPCCSWGRHWAVWGLWFCV
jgi:hypothetical protein